QPGYSSVGIVAAQRPQELADVDLGHAGQIVDAALHQVVVVAAQVAAVGTQRVRGSASLDGQMVEIALHLAVERRGGADARSKSVGGHWLRCRCAKDVGRPGHGASTGRVGLPSTTAAYAASTPAAAEALTISPESTRSAASSSDTQCTVRSASSSVASGRS